MTELDTEDYGKPHDALFGWFDHFAAIAAAIRRRLEKEAR